MYACVKLNEKDSVATVTKPLNIGDIIKYKFKGEEYELGIISDIPVYHKVALCDVAKGSAVYKYGQKIGYALCDIKAGEHVHTRNLGSKQI